ncbi:hypothetical protein RSOLAG22IIIB_07815 [Rhizoctonia solani]|uniref:Uncharacterized protein n=1 Tax=Rhizoctonia solani TaxID=456999 RepID=A0A0K6FQA5_9AGAM|nr:hypothetical protein RSOLAG22IIIB_07815 [Rhizoctonia solani]
MHLRCTNYFRRGAVVAFRPRTLLTRSLETCAVYGSFEEAAIAAANYVVTGAKPPQDSLWGERAKQLRNGTTPTDNTPQTPTPKTLVVEMTQYKSISGPKEGQVVGEVDPYVIVGQNRFNAKLCTTGIGVPDVPAKYADFLRIDYDKPDWRPDSKDPNEYKKQVRKFAELMKKLENDREAPLGIHFNAHYVEKGAVIQEKAFAAYIDMGTKKLWELQEEYDGYLKRLLYKPAITIWDRWRMGEQPR